jgi:hypothetical protein
MMMMLMRPVNGIGKRMGRMRVMMKVIGMIGKG